MDVKKALNLFEKIGATSSRNEKEDLIRQGVGNTPFRRLLYLTYDPFSVYGIKKIPKVKHYKHNDVDRYETNLQDFNELLDRLAKRIVTGNSAREEVEDFLSWCNEQEYNWYSKVIKRDLKIGITSKTINKVIKGLIPVFECALAEKYKEKKVPELFIVERKLDGYRCLAFHWEDGTVELRTRNGKEILGYDRIEEQVRKLPSGFLYDGGIMGREGTFSEVQSSAFKKTDNKDGVLHIFDMIHISDFERNAFDVSLRARRKGLERLQETVDTCDSLLIVEMYGPFNNTEEDLEEVFELHTQFVSEGYEGTMIKDYSAQYKMGRSYNIQKIKDMETADLEITGVYEGKEGTKYEGTLGGVYVDWKGKQVGVGSGFSDDLRDKIWANPSEYINKVIEVWFQEESTNKKGEKAIRFGVFKGFRPDKE